MYTYIYIYVYTYTFTLHPQVDEDPSQAPCDGKLQWPIDKLDSLLHSWTLIAEARQQADPLPEP